MTPHSAAAHIHTAAALPEPHDPKLPWHAYVDATGTASASSHHLPSASSFPDVDTLLFFTTRSASSTDSQSPGRYRRARVDAITRPHCSLLLPVVCCSASWSLQ